MISNNLSNSITIENSESIQLKNNNLFKNINNTNKNYIYRFNSKSNEMKNNMSNQYVKPQSYAVSPNLLYSNIFINILRNIASSKLSQYTNDNGILMPLFMSFNIFIVNLIFLCYKNLLGKELRTDLNILYPITNGFLNSIALTLIAWAESGDEIDGPTNSGLYLLYFPIAAMMKSYLLDRYVSIYTWINIAIIMSGVYCIVRFNFKNIKAGRDKDKGLKKRFKHYVRNNGNNQNKLIEDLKLDNEQNKYVQDGKIKLEKEKYDKYNKNASKIAFDNDDIGYNDNIDKNYEEYYSLSRFEELNKFKKEEKKEKPRKSKNKDVKTDDFDYDVSKFLNKNNSETYNENEVRVWKITAKATGVILLCFTYYGTFMTFKYNSYSVIYFTVIYNLSTLIFISILSLFIISYAKMKYTNIIEIITARFYQYFFGFYLSENFKVAQMSKYAWITTLTTNLSQFYRIQICRAGVLGFGGSWGFVLSPFIFGSEFVMQNKKKDLNVLTLIGCILISVGIRLNAIMTKRMNTKIYYMGAMDKKRANGNQLDFT